MDSQMNAVEDYLQEAKVFVSGIDDRVCHMDSYMTVMDYKAFDKAMENPPFTKPELLRAADEMSGFAYMSPMAMLTAYQIQTKYCPAFGPILTCARLQEKINKGN